MDKLREAFHNNDFSTLPVKDQSEYYEEEIKLYNNEGRIVRRDSGELSEEYNQSEIAKKLGASQSTVSRKVSKFKKSLSAGVSIRSG